MRRCLGAGPVGALDKVGTDGRDRGMAAAAGGADVQPERICALGETEVHPVAQPEAWPPGDESGRVSVKPSPVEIGVTSRAAGIVYDSYA